MFRQIWFSHEQDEPDKYFLAYNDCYYFIDIFRVKVWGETRDNCKCWCFKYDIVNIHSTTSSMQEYVLGDMLKLLNEVLFINSKHIGKRKIDDKTEIIVMYKGEEI